MFGSVTNGIVKYYIYSLLCVLLGSNEMISQKFMEQVSNSDFYRSASNQLTEQLAVTEKKCTCLVTFKRYKDYMY